MGGGGGGGGGGRQLEGLLTFSPEKGVSWNVCLGFAYCTYKCTSYFSISLTCIQITILSKQFVHWDNVLTEIEQAVDVKPSD